MLGSSQLPPVIHLVRQHSEKNLDVESGFRCEVCEGQRTFIGRRRVSIKHNIWLLDAVTVWEVVYTGWMFQFKSMYSASLMSSEKNFELSVPIDTQCHIAHRPKTLVSTVLTTKTGRTQIRFAQTNSHIQWTSWQDLKHLVERLLCSYLSLHFFMNASTLNIF